MASSQTNYGPGGEPAHTSTPQAMSPILSQYPAELHLDLDSTEEDYESDNSDGIGLEDPDPDSATFPPPGQRLAPVGANAEEDELEKKAFMKTLDHLESSMNWQSEKDLEIKLKQLEEEQEELNSSLMAMTSHFARVQLRLQQVVSAPAEKREDLLKELEKFAFRGIPNLSSPRIEHQGVSPRPSGSNNGYADKSCEDVVQGQHEEKKEAIVNDEILEAQRRRQTELIQQLKGQLEDLESYAFESGEEIVPSNLLLERQRIVMEQLKARLNLNMDNIVKLSEEELKAEVDSAVGQIVNPLKMKNHLVGQLKTQITDLEMFIQFLQSETSTMVPMECHGCGCSKHNSPTHQGSNHQVSKVKKFRTRTKSEQEELRKQTESILEKAVAVLQLTAMSQFGCGRKEQFYKNTLKNTVKGNHYGDLRARLELAVDHIFEACSKVECLTTDTDATSVASLDGADGTPQPEYLMSSSQITSVVRKEFAPAIRDLMQHGLIQASKSTSLVPFMSCVSAKSSSTVNSAPHAWDVILRYYKLKQGDEFNSAPQRKLSQSFGLDLAGSMSSAKQSLLSTIGQIMSTHGQYKRSRDAHFKAFICVGLTKRKLIQWLKLILRNQTILESMYQPWSYVVKTGFDDAFKAIDRLSIYVFDLPTDVAVRQFQNLSEAF